METDMAAGFERIVSEDATLDVVAHGLYFGEGPVWDAHEGCLYYVDIIGDAIWKYTPGVGNEVVIRPSNHADGMTLDQERRLVVAGWASRSVWRRERDGSLVTLASHYQGKKLNTPNDIVVKSDGAIYFTDPSGALFNLGQASPEDDLQRYLDFHGVFRIGPDGGDLSLAVEDFPYPNGLCFSPDESLLYVNDTWQANIRVFDVQPDGSVTNGRLFYELVGEEPGVADGMKVDAEGNVYVTGPGGIHVTDPEGRLLGRLRVPAHATNLAWGDDDWQTLYITTHSPGMVYRVRLKVPGVPVPAERR
jgi:gluconolactonase